MSAQEEIIVVGGGLEGVSAAYELTARGHGVRLVEAREDVGLETSFANGGLLTPSAADPWNSPGVHRHVLAALVGRDPVLKIRLGALPSIIGWGARFLLNSRAAPNRAATLATYRLADYSLRATRELAQRLDLAFDGSALGTLKVFRSPSALEASIALMRLLESEGARAELLDADGAVKVEPHLADVRGQLVGAVRYPDDGCGDAHLFCRALAERLEAAGGRIERGSPVAGLRLENGRITGVQTGAGFQAAQRVVVAAGVRSAALCATVGVALPIRPVKGYSVTLQMDPSRPMPRVPVLDDTLHVTATPLGSRMRVAGTAEFAGYDASLNAERIANLMDVLAAVYPTLARELAGADASPWAGLRPMTSDGLPYICATPVPGLWVDSGHGHLGWTLATGSARLLADLMEDRPPVVDPAPFRIGR